MLLTFKSALACLYQRYVGSNHAPPNTQLRTYMILVFVLLCSILLSPSMFHLKFLISTTPCDIGKNANKEYTSIHECAHPFSLIVSASHSELAITFCSSFGVHSCTICKDAVPLSVVAQEIASFLWGNSSLIPLCSSYSISYHPVSCS